MRSVSESLVPISELRFETAAEYYPREVPLAAPYDTVQSIRNSLAGRRYDSVAEMVVCEANGRLVGLVKIEDLLAAKADVRLLTIMDTSQPVVQSAVDQELAA